MTSSLYYIMVLFYIKSIIGIHLFSPAGTFADENSQ